MSSGARDSGDFLQQMAIASRARLEAARSSRSEGELLKEALATAAPPPLRADSAGFDLIAELKLRSPAVGRLKSAQEEDIAERVVGYARAGAAAVSILTEPTRFDGSLEHLRTAAAALASRQVAAMRKDFLVDPYQVIEARAAGASGVLVILRMLSRAGTEALLDCARELGLFVLLEAFDERDIEDMHNLIGHVAPPSPSATDPRTPPVLAGLNCRDLTTLQIVPRRLTELAQLLPANVPRVAESGVVSPGDAAQVAAAGYEYALVGSALMRGGDPQALARSLLKAGRERARVRK